jgi:hypothetical protein
MFFKYLFTTLHYLFTPIRFILFSIVLILLFILIGINNERYVPAISQFFTNILLYLLSIRLIVDNKDIIKYLEYIYSDKKFVVVFNHTALMDPIILFNVFQPCCCVLLETAFLKVFGYGEKTHKKIKNIYVNNGDTTKKILDYIQNRKSGDSALFIAPGAGNMSKNPDDITEFKGKGAFIGKYPVLPVIMKYEDNSVHHNSDNGESMFHSFIKLILLDNYKIMIKVGDLIETNDNETAKEYSDRVYNNMNDIYHNMKL